MALSIGLLSMTALSTNSYAAGMQGKPSAEFFKQLDHASFMPNLMKHIMHNKSDLNLSKEQVQELKKYKKKNSPKIHDMVASLIDVENQARTRALENYPPEKVAELAMFSLQIRQDIFNAKLQCRSFVKSILTPEQYKKALTTYK